MSAKEVAHKSPWQSRLRFARSPALTAKERSGQESLSPRAEAVMARKGSEAGPGGNSICHARKGSQCKPRSLDRLGLPPPNPKFAFAME